MHLTLISFTLKIKKIIKILNLFKNYIEIGIFPVF
jgi:hypothetical protein